MDVLLADSDGRELTRYIKDTDELKHIPVIMLSAHSGLSDMVDNFGNEDFLEKPFDANTLIERIHKLLNATNNA